MDTYIGREEIKFILAYIIAFVLMARVVPRCSQEGIREVRFLSSLLLISIVIILIYDICHNPFMRNPYISEFFINVKQSVYEIYLENFEYLLTAILLSVEVYLFVAILMRIAVYRLESPPKGIPKEISGYARVIYLLLYTFILFILLVIPVRMAGALKETYYSVIRRSARKARKDQEYFKTFFFLTYLISGIVIGAVASFLCQINRMVICPLLSIIALLFSFLLIDALGNIKELRGIVISIENNKLLFSGNLYIESNSMFLSYSICTGIAGIFTTLIAFLTKTTYIFTLIPVTFDMISLITAVMELVNIKEILNIFRGFDKSGTGLFCLAPLISWSVYLCGLIKLVFSSKFEDSVLISIVAFWILLSAFLGILHRRFSLSLRSVAMALFIYSIPFILIYIS